MKRVFGNDRLVQAQDGVQPLAKGLLGTGEKDRGGPAQISAGLKSWFDNVIIPSLIKLYLSEQDEPKAARETTLAGSGKRIYTRPISERRQ